MNKPSIQTDFSDVINLEALANWMTEQGLGEGAIENSRLLAGGTQNYLLHYERDGCGYVLRRPPKHLRKNSNESMRREAKVLSALTGSKVPHPAFIAECRDATVLGCSFYLMEPVAGFTATEGLPDYHANDATVRRRMGFSFVEGIAALAAVDYKSVGLEGFGRPDGFLERQVPRWQTQLQSYSELDRWPGPSMLPGVDEIANWLQSNCPKSFTPGIMHGDYHLSNVMFHTDSAELAAIIDWELCTIGDPLLDLGWLMALWPCEEDDAGLIVEPWEGFPSIEELIAHYAARTDRNMEAINWYGVMACFKLAVLLEGSYARACAGLIPAKIGETLHNTAIQLFERGLRLMRNGNG